MRVYIAGPMSGCPDWNFPAFHAAAERWRDAGHEVVNPAENDKGSTDKPWDYYLRLDLKMLPDCDAVAVLPGWQRSRGASLEVHVARALGMTVFDAETMEPQHETAVQEAQRLVHGDRNADYGHPIDDMTRTGRMWAAILGLPEVSAEQVALCMVAVKISRECNKPKRDNRVDGAGYFETVEMIHEERARRVTP